MKRIYKKLSAIFLSCLLMVCLLPMGQLFTFAADDLIEIKTVEDLISLSKSCESDAWSKGKTVKLMADLDLKGSGFTCIPVFSGVFDGGDYKITGFELGNLGIASGFFRYISQDAEVKNLIVEGVVSTENKGECVGGIAGVNRGTISNCVFSGSINGNQSVAAIAGENAKTGLIRYCVAKGTVDAPYEAGGIAGSNHGVIRGCNNKAVINNNRAFIDELDEEGISWIIGTISLEENIRITAGTDVGGIAGYSDGSIFSCNNLATVGYEHTGYNVGGIVGRQAGVVSSCVNNGTVLGRKDVGGIVGQMEPFVSVDEAASISDAVKDLHDLVDKLLDDLSDSEKGISSDLDEIKKHTDVALGLGDDISQELVDFTNSNIDAMNLLADEVEYVLDNLPAILDSLDLSVSAARRFGDDLKKINDDLDVINKLDKNAYSETKYSRLTLTSAVGGYVSSDNSNPEKDITVKLTVHTDEGYKLSTLVIYDSNSKSVSYTDNGDGTYTFVMPEENVVVRTVYSYVGNFYLQSNAGGSLSKAYSKDTETLKVTVKPNSGYTFEKLLVGDKEYAITEFNHDETQNTYTIELPQALPSGAVYISTQFQKEESSHTVTVASTTGGVVTADKALCGKDETVTVRVTEAADYILSRLTLIVNGQETDLIAGRTAEEALANPNEYTFIMPDENAKVEAEFKYSDTAKDNEETVLYTESTVGGSMYFVKNPTTNDYIIYIIPEAGYEVVATSSIAIFTAAKSGQETANPAGVLTTEQLTQYGNGYSYTLNYTQFETPIRAFGSFAKVESSNSVMVTSSTGGTASVDKVAAKEGDEINLAVLPASGYRVKSISIMSQGQIVSYSEKEDTNNVYNFTMPNGNVDIEVEFAPIVFIITSNYGGQVSVTANGDTIKFTVTPDDGYTLNEAPKVVDAEGNAITLVKRTAGVFSYEFDLTGKTEPIKAEIKFEGATDYEVVENSKDTINEQSKKLTNSMNDIKKTVEEITDLVTDDYGEIVDAEEFVKNTDDVNELIRLLVKLAKELTEAGEAASYLISSMNTLTNVLVPYITDAAKAVQEDAQKAVDDLDDCLKNLQDAGNQVKAVVEYLNSQPSVNFTELSDGFSKNVSSLFDEMKKISDGMGKVNTDVSGYTDTILDDLRAINDKTNEILELIIDLVNNVENAYKNDEIIFEDVSDEELETVVEGKVSGCINYGEVRADLNVGGIAGSMSVDTEDPEDNAAGSVDWSVHNTYVTKCVLIACTNNGSATAKSDGVGAIVGCQGIGVVSECTAYGTVTSKEGEYVGGIVGLSRAIVRNCNSLCSLSGGNYVGGIVGYGNKLANNYSIAIVTEGKNQVGAIAGQVKLEDSTHSINSENVHDNKYVGNIGGIDGISYAGIAEGLSYAELKEIPGINYGFSHLTVTFIADDKQIGKTECKYGSKVSDLTFPDLPVKEGYYGVWQDVTGLTVEGNIFITAEYYENITTIKSDSVATITNSEGKEYDKNLVLIDGVFDSKANLLVDLNKESFPEELSAGQDSVVYTVSLSGAESKEAKIRLFNTLNKNVKAYEKVNGQWIEVDSTEYGSYQQVIMSNGSGTFALVAQKKSYLKYIVIASGAAGVMVVLIIIQRIVAAVRKKKAKK